jgi:hypothetical protein
MTDSALPAGMVGAILCGSVAASHFAFAFNQYSTAAAFASAKQLVLKGGHLDSSGNASQDLTAHEGQWVAVSGTVLAADGAKPLTSYNGTDAVILRQTISISSRNLFLLRASHTNTAVTWKCVPWGLGPLHPSQEWKRQPVPFVCVEPNAVLKTSQTNASNIRDLVAAGQARTSAADPWYVRLAMLLVGNVSYAVNNDEAVLPVGISATVLGSLCLTADGTVKLGIHPRFGFYVMRTNVGAVVDMLHEAASASVWWGVAWLLPAVYFGLRAAALAFPEALPSIQQLFNTRAQLPVRNLHSVDEASIAPGANIIDAVDEAAPSRDTECIACQERRIIALLTPCNHMCLCMTCAKRLRNSSTPRERRCPLCRQYIDNVVRVFHTGAGDVT